MFHTYIDWTDDGRPFYVGMGDDARVARADRNIHHTRVSRKHGRRREVVISTENRQETVDLEIKLIAEHHTFVDDPLYNGIGCNYTPGGEGHPCSDAMKQQMRDIIRAQYTAGRQPWNKGKHVKYRRTEKSLAQRRASIIAFNQTLPMLGKHHTETTKERMRKPHICSMCKTIGHTKTTCPERPVDAVNVVSLAQQRRHQR